MANVVFKVTYLIYYISFFSLYKIQQSDSSSNVQTKGKYYIIELTTLRANQSGKLSFEAIRFHMNLLVHISIANAYQTQLKGSQIGYVSYDIGNKSKLLKDAITDITLDSKFRLTQNGNQYNNTNHECEKPYSNIIAVISFLPYHLSKLAAELLSIVEIPLLMHYNETKGYLRYLKPTSAYTSEQILLDRSNYYFIETIIKYDIRLVSLVVLGNTNKRFALKHRQYIWDLLMRNPRLCVDMVDFNGNNISEVRNYIHDDSFRIIIIWSTMQTKPFLDIVYSTYGSNNKIWYLYSDGPWYNKLDGNIDPGERSMYNIIFHPVHSGLYIFTSYSNYPRKYPQFFPLLLKDIWIRKFMDECKLNKTLNELLNHFEARKQLVTYSDILFFPLYLSKYFKKKLSGRVEYVWQKMWKSQSSFTFTYRGNFTNRRVWTPHNYTGNRDLICKPPRCYPGREPIKEVCIRSKHMRKLAWYCNQCELNHYKLKYSNGSCSKCEYDFLSNQNRSHCDDPYKTIYLSYFDTYSVVLLLFLIPSCIFNMIAIAIYVKHRETPIIRASGFHISLVKLCAHLFLNITILTLFIVELSLIICTAQVVVTGALLAFVMSLTITKIHKLLYAFQAKVIIDEKHILVSKITEVCISVLLLTIQGIICFISFKSNSKPLKISLNKSDYTRNVYCINRNHFDFQFIYILLLSMFCSIQGFRARNLPQYFRESQSIAYAMYVTIIIIISRFPLAYSYSGIQGNFLHALIINLLNNSQLIVGFSSTIFVIIFQPEKNTRRHFKVIFNRDAKAWTEKKMEERKRKIQN